jgi:hypothetical protein
MDISARPFIFYSLSPNCLSNAGLAALYSGHIIQKRLVQKLSSSIFYSGAMMPT